MRAFVLLLVANDVNGFRQIAREQANQTSNATNLHEDLGQHRKSIVEAGGVTPLVHVLVTSSDAEAQCESETGHRCGQGKGGPGQGVCDTGRCCGTSGWCRSCDVFGDGGQSWIDTFDMNPKWSNNFGGVCSTIAPPQAALGSVCETETNQKCGAVQNVYGFCKSHRCCNYGRCVDEHHVVTAGSSPFLHRVMASLKSEKVTTGSWQCLDSSHGYHQWGWDKKQVCNGKAYHLAPKGWNECDFGTPAGKDECEDAAAWAGANIDAGLEEGSWRHTPGGCFVISGNPAPAHYNTRKRSKNDGRYALVCSGKKV